MFVLACGGIALALAAATALNGTRLARTGGVAQVKEFGSDFRSFGSKIERKFNVDGAGILVRRCSEDLLR
jgi:hypothetical protein